MRSWEDNKRAINQLWPQCTFTDEERRLWHDDLSGLDQDVLYDAIRNVKRAHDTLYPQLKWFREEYRHLSRLRGFAKNKASTSEPRQTVEIDNEKNNQMRDDLRAAIDVASPSDYQSLVALIADKAAALAINMETAFKLVNYAIQRFGLDEGSGGRIRNDGGTDPFPRGTSA
jgi:hypothetical protein